LIDTGFCFGILYKQSKKLFYKYMLTREDLQNIGLEFRKVVEQNIIPLTNNMFNKMEDKNVPKKQVKQFQVSVGKA